MLGEGGHEIAPVGADKELLEARQILLREEGRFEEVAVVSRGAPGFPRGQFQQRLDPALAPLHEKRVLHHREERRGEGQGETKPDPVAGQVIHHPQKRKVGLYDRLVEPVLLEEVLVLGVPYERQMGVKNRAPESERVLRRDAFTDDRDRLLLPGPAAPG